MQSIEWVKVATQHSPKGDCKDVQKYTVEQRKDKKRIERFSLKQYGKTRKRQITSDKSVITVLRFDLQTL